jgi:hypothetical protein
MEESSRTGQIETRPDADRNYLSGPVANFTDDLQKLSIHDFMGKVARNFADLVEDSRKKKAT